MAKVFRPGGLATHPFYYYHFSRRLRLILVSICKNACTVQKRWLLEAEGVSSVGDVHRAAYERFSLLRMPAHEQEAAMASVPIVAFVRDPYLRLASAYRNKLVGGLSLPSASAIEGVAARRGVRIERDATIPFGSDGSRFASCSRVDYARGVSFREFVEYVAGTPDLELDPHWRSQAWHLGPMIRRAQRPNSPQTLLLPVRRLSEVLGTIGRPHGLEAPAERAAPRNEPDEAPEALSDVPSGDLRGRGRPPRAEDLFDERLIALVRERFAPDIACWERVEGAPAAGEALRARLAHACG